MPKKNKVLKSLIGFLVPHSLVLMRNSYRAKKLHIERHKKMSELNVNNQKLNYSYQNTIDFLVSRGCALEHVIQGSMPSDSLDTCKKQIDHYFDKEKPLIGLHIGNFLGVSLSYFADVVKNFNDKSLIFSIDPNIPHRGIENPQSNVVELLSYFGLSKNTSIMVGYSIEKSVSNDGIQYTSYDPFTNYNKEHSCEYALHNLIASGARFNFIVCDGNHDASYLNREIELIKILLKDDGLLILDDVSTFWSEISNTYEKIDPLTFEKVLTDGRVGILKKIAKNV